MRNLQEAKWMLLTDLHKCQSNKSPLHICVVVKTVEHQHLTHKNDLKHLSRLDWNLIKATLQDYKTAIHVQSLLLLGV